MGYFLEGLLPFKKRIENALVEISEVRKIVSVLQPPQNSDLDFQNSHYEILPGTQYSRVAIPLEYEPSRNFAPRWGYSKPVIPQIAEWLTSHDIRYYDLIEEMFLNVPEIDLNYPGNSSTSPAWIGGAICAFDALALYHLVSKYKPKRYLEIGSGMTTLFAARAVVDGKLKTRITSVDPEPRQFVDKVCDEIIRAPIETIDFLIFQELEAGDILFLDGSHRSFMNSDVTVFFIDILPLLKPGVIIHIHDIMLPWDYHDSIKNWYWNEQYLLAVYLMGNLKSLIPILPTMWVCRNEITRQLIKSKHPDLGSDEMNESWTGGGSFWFTKTE